MFIARVLVRTVKGKRYYTHRLIGSERVDGRRRQRTILGLGAHYPIPKEQWRLLCTILQDLVDPPMQQRLGGIDPPDLVREARHLIRRMDSKSN